MSYIKWLHSKLKRNNEYIIEVFLTDYVYADFIHACIDANSYSFRPIVESHMPSKTALTYSAILRVDKNELTHTLMSIKSVYRVSVNKK